MNEVVPSDDRGYLYGDALFETVRIEEGRVYFLEYHRRRFERSARLLRFRPQVRERGLDALASLSGRDDGLWRVTVSRADPNDSEPETSVITVRRRELPARKNGGLALGMVDNFYFPEFSIHEHKTSSWLRSVEARRRAKRRGFDEALLVSREGRIGEAAAANVFFYVAGGWITPPVEGILPGVIRSVLLERGSPGGTPICERPVFVGDLESCEAMALTSSGRLVSPVSRVEDMRFAIEPVKALEKTLLETLK